MSEPVSHATATLPASEAPSPGEGGPFTETQVEQFEEDDGDAGRAIGKMLALFFLYTIIAMSGVAWWTFHHQSH
jgi:hypothetical protein